MLEKRMNHSPLKFQEAVEIISSNDQISPEGHVLLSKATDRADYGSGVIEDRIRANLEPMLMSFLEFVKAANQMDLKVKRTIFYGTGPGTPEYAKKQAAFKLGEDLLEKAIQEILEKDQRGEFAITGVLSAVIHYTMGAGTETGEIIEAVTKYMHNGDLDLVNIGEEFGDVFWYASNLFHLLELNYGTVMAKNSKKLILKRYKNGGFTEQQAVQRNTDAEREVLAAHPVEESSQIPAENSSTSPCEAGDERETHLENCVQEMTDLILDADMLTRGLFDDVVKIYNKAEIRVKRKSTEDAA